jgi:hypothetical protein
VELGEYDISGPTEYMSTKEKAVSKDELGADFFIFVNKPSLSIEFISR